MNEIETGFWVINASSVTKSVVFNCVTCCKLRGKMAVQIMTDLPKDRFREAAPSMYCAIDMFGPFKIKFK